MNIKKFADLTIKHSASRWGKDPTIESLYGAWHNERAQMIRLRIMSEIDDLNGKSILDVGCGLGAFYYYCKEKNIKFGKYVGIDIMPIVVEQANHELDISCMDILENDFDSNSFDYVIISGVTYFTMPDWTERTRLIIKKCYRISRLGIGINFLRWRKENKNSKSHYEKYNNITEVIEYCTNNYVIRADYKKNDFTVYAYKKRLQ